MKCPRQFFHVTSLTAGVLLIAFAHSQARDVFRITPAGRKAAAIIIPNIEFRSTTVADGIEFLRQESVRLDTTDPDPVMRGVNIYIKMPALTSQPGATALPSGPMECFPAPFTASSRITLMLRNVPLLEALRYIAVQCGLKVVVDEYVICLVTPDTNTDVVVLPPELEEAVFSVSPEMGSALAALLPLVKGDPSTATGLDPMPWLRKEGVSSPAGASAVYLPLARRLVVRNTWENIERIRALFPHAEGSDK